MTTINKILNPYGKEPMEIDGYSRAFNWYAYEKTKSDALKYILTYAKKELESFYDELSQINESSIIPTYGWLARMLSIGSIKDETEIASKKKIIRDYIESLCTSLRTKKVKVQTVTPIVKAKTEDKILPDLPKELDEEMGEMEYILDEYYTHKKRQNIGIHLKKNAIPLRRMSVYIDWIDSKIKEFTIAEDDDEMQEAYSNHSLRRTLSYLGQIKEDISLYFNERKAQRKPKKTRIKSPVELTKHVRYLKEYGEIKGLNLTSVHPSEIIGAEQVWTYNTRYKRLSVIKSNDDSGLSVSGLSILNYDIDNSHSRALRKPEQTIPYVLEYGKVMLKEIIPKLTTKPQPINNRMGDDVIILRILK